MCVYFAWMPVWDVVTRTSFIRLLCFEASRACSFVFRLKNKDCATSPSSFPDFIYSGSWGPSLQWFPSTHPHMSTPSPADSRCETCERIVLLSLSCVTITWQRIFKGSLKVIISVRFSACDCWPRTSLPGDAVRKWLLITVRRVALYCVKRSRGESVAMLPLLQVSQIHYSVRLWVIMGAIRWGRGARPPTFSDSGDVICPNIFLFRFRNTAYWFCTKLSLSHFTTKLRSWVWPMCLCDKLNQATLTQASLTQYKTEIPPLKVLWKCVLTVKAQFWLVSEY